MTTSSDLDALTRKWFAMMQDASAIHIRDRHCGERFDECPFFPCGMVREISAELLREYGKLHTRESKPKLDMCAVAEMLKPHSFDCPVAPIEEV